MQLVTLPDGVEVEFPDNMGQDAIQKALRQQFGGQPSPLPDAPLDPGRFDKTRRRFEPRGFGRAKEGQAVAPVPPPAPPAAPFADLTPAPIAPPDPARFDKTRRMFTPRQPAPVAADKS